jgi:hypothetical protein
MRYLISSSELDTILAPVKQNSKSNKNLVRRILDAERIAKDLSGAMLKIQHARLHFLVRVIGEIASQLVIHLLPTDANYIKLGGQSGWYATGCQTDEGLSI